MTVVIERLNRDTHELEQIARVDDGEFVSGRDRVEDLFVDPDDLPSEDEIVDRFRGPSLFAGFVDESADGP